MNSTSKAKCARPPLRVKLLCSCLALIVSIPAKAYAEVSQADFATADSTSDSRYRLRDLMIVEIGKGTADPAGDARRAVRVGQFGLIAAEFGMGGSEAPAGVLCFTPYRVAPEILLPLAGGDVITPEKMAQLNYAATYNRTLVEDLAFPHRDLCRPSVEADKNIDGNEILVTRPARDVSGPIASLHEAARRGTPRDVRRLLGETPIDKTDQFGMTPLAWAVARDNRPVMKLLLERGANPWVGRRRIEPASWAARLGRAEVFTVLQSAPGRRFTSWPTHYLQGAMEGGSVAIVNTILGQPHEPLRPQEIRRPLPSAEVLVPVLKQEGVVIADALLLAAISEYTEPQLDLARLALANGADPNARQTGARRRTALDVAAGAAYPECVEAVELLIRSGADANLASGRTRPLWTAFQAMWRSEVLQTDQAFRLAHGKRAAVIFDRLLAAGADINLADEQGRPPIWFILFPRWGDPEKLDPSFVNPERLQMLKGRGLDFNAEFRGKRALVEVERQAGKNSELAKMLRALGARG